MGAFDRIGQLEMGEGAAAQLTQLILNSREAAIDTAAGGDRSSH